MSRPLSRRGLLGAGALGIALSGLGGLTACGRPDRPTARSAVGCGPLRQDPEGILALPSGFTCTVLARSGVPATADVIHPSDPDGMGVFAGPRGGSILVCNHENDGSEPHAVPPVDGLTEDHGYVFEVDPASRGANLGSSPAPLKFLGRYSHEAVAVDPSTTRIHRTEGARSPTASPSAGLPRPGSSPAVARCARRPGHGVPPRTG